MASNNAAKGAADAEERRRVREVKELKAQLRGMDILLQQNAALEKEVERINIELDELTLGVQKKGCLYKWREREIFFAAKWGLRYFVLQGNRLSYYTSESENRPRRTIDLSNCFVRDEGTKKGGIYNTFSVYLGADSGSDDGEDGLLLLRVSSESAAEAALWIDMLQQGCSLDTPGETPDSLDVIRPVPLLASPPDTVDGLEQVQGEHGEHGEQSVWRADGAEFDPIEVVMEHVPLKEDKEGQGEKKEGETADWGHTHIIRSTGDLVDMLDESVQNTLALPFSMLQRVKSASKVLMKSQSRHNLARRLAGLAPHSDSTATPTSASVSSSAPQTAHAIGQVKGKHSKGGFKAFPGFKPLHVKAQSSPLSPDTGEHNFRGFFNLGVIILVISHLELIINNLTRFGFKATSPMLMLSWMLAAPPLTDIALLNQSVRHSPRLQFALIAISQWTLSVGGCFLLELWAASRRWRAHESVVLCLSVLLSAATLVFPVYFVWTNDAQPFSNMLYLFQSVIIWMKLISYSHANSDLRTAARKSKRLDLDASRAGRTSRAGSGACTPPAPASRTSSCDNMDNNAKPLNDAMAVMLAECQDLQPPFLLYPSNLTARNLGYFLVAPTLCYQLNYPRSKKIRWTAVAFILVRLLFVGGIILFSCEQYIVPTLEISLAPMQNYDVLMIIERLLKLSIPNTYVWLLGFYFYFHLWLNLLAELTRFGDRQFYKEWWNARTIDGYWRTWNMPVHHWITRHFYYPLLRMGANKTLATLLVFTFSAAMHELVISVPFRYIACHAFFGMMGQAPMIIITKYIDRRFDNAFLGNAIFWLLFTIVGQPVGIMMYFYDLWRISLPLPQ